MRWAIVTGAALLAAAPALALTADEAKSIFFGYDMTGYLAGANVKWRECIRPAGDTSYWFQGEYDRGRLRVRADGRLCFSYKSTDYSREACFIAEKTGANWRFTDEADSGTVFVTTHTKRVRSCPTDEAPVS